MSTPVSGPGTWRVDSQSPTSKIDRTNNVVEGYDIAFTTGLGNHGTVFVPHLQYTPPLVRDAVAAAAAAVDAVGQLTSESDV